MAPASQDDPVIATEREDSELRAAAPKLVALPTPRGVPAAGHRRTGFARKASAVIVIVAFLSTLGGGEFVDSGYAMVLQSEAAALHARWGTMVVQGIPATDLLQLEQEWTYSQRSRFMGAAMMFWTPGARAVVDQWQAQTDRIWYRDLSRYRTDATIQEAVLHRAFGTEPLVQRKARLEGLATATTPADFEALRSTWNLEARLVPIDRGVAAAVASLGDQTQQAKAIGIRSDPAGAVIVRADAYTLMTIQERMARAELLIRTLGSVRQDLQARLAAAAITQQAYNHATGEISTAGVYGIDLSRYQGRVDADHAAYANAITAGEFTRITGDLNQVAGAADGAINTVLSETHVISGVAFYYQSHSLSCEETATSMALTHQGIYLSQDQILAEAGADTRPMYVDSAGRVRWGDPYVSFVGNVNGSEHNYTGYQMNYPPLVRIAQAHGARVIAYGSMSAATIYARVIAGHPVVAYATWDWAWHPRHDYLAFDGQWVPWIGPSADAHVYTVVGVSPSQVLVNDPIRGQYWVSKGAFQAAYSDFGEAIVFA
jgi:uncharacterized protein YvpB